MTPLTVDVRGGGGEARELRRLAERVLKGEGKDEAELCVSIVSRDAMEALNQRYTGRSGATDVLSFPLAEGDGGEHSHGHLGDVVVCRAQAVSQARDRAVDPREELRRLVVHGILHLLGYRDTDAVRRREMLSVQEAYVAGRRGP